MMVAVVATLCLVGLVMVLSASSVASLRSFGTPWRYFERQGMYLGAGAVAFFAAQGIEISFWQRVARPLMFVAGAALLGVLVAGRSAGGASRWLGSGSFQFQPSELAKLALVLFAADVLARREGKGTWLYRTVPVLIVMGAYVLLIMRQPDMGTAVVVCCAGAAVLFAARHAAPDNVVAGPRRRPRRLRNGYLGQLPRRPDNLVPPPLRQCQHHRLPVRPGDNRPGRRALAGYRDRPEPGQLGLLPNQYTDFIFAVIGRKLALRAAW